MKPRYRWSHDRNCWLRQSDHFARRLFRSDEAMRRALHDSTLLHGTLMALRGAWMA